MNIIVNKADDGTIEFLNEGMIIYDISPKLKKWGKDYWTKVMRFKRWFLPEVEKEMLEVWD